MRRPRVITVDARETCVLELVDLRGFKRIYRLTLSGLYRDKARLERPDDRMSPDRHTRG